MKFKISTICGLFLLILFSSIGFSLPLSLCSCICVLLPFCVILVELCTEIPRGYKVCLDLLRTSLMFLLCTIKLLPDAPELSVDQGAVGIHSTQLTYSITKTLVDAL